MKRRTFALSALSVLALPPVLAACSGGDDSGAIRAGSTGQSFPNSYQEDGTLIGFDVELIETIAEALGRSVTWTNADFSGLMGQLEARKLETVANNVAVTEERSAQYDFTEPYAYMGAVVGALGSNTELNELADIAGHTIAGVLGSNNTTHLETWAAENGVDVEIRTYETRDGAMQDLLAGRVDGYIQSSGIFYAEMQKSGADLKFVGEPIAWESVAFPFEKGSELVAQFNEQITALREAGTLLELSEKYYGDDVVTEPEGYTGG
ncbi:transporter substrate-binding domain-containing protein [Brachybacterium sp. J144]|uniref:transporter substrate-binding domain-containing protein n=1 Tax=Brachybacterium sp. J144 TaxID=3116487 RepID=UPI002E78E21B|nr:transporter substrate-binding domain-containing protein [Brachybacterium sp. J144]MEE1650710.1 transporter substrate-binding domain-containing protein [Brachybacterium sp. J144]